MSRVQQVLETGPVQGRERAAGMGAGQEGEAGGQRTTPHYQMGAGQVPLLNQVPHQPSVEKTNLYLKTLGDLRKTLVSFL